MLRFLPLVAALCPPQASKPASRPKPRVHSCRFVQEIRNAGAEPLTKLEIRLALPRSLDRQELRFLRVSKGAKIREDAHGNEVAIFERDELAAGATFRAQWFATVELEGRVARGRAKPAQLTPAERARYLADRRVYRVADARVRELAAQAARGAKTPLAKARAVHDLVLDKLRYVRDGRWDPAPVCLQKGEGSCSEYSYCFIALCRALGMPARYEGGTALRGPGMRGERFELYEDSVFHRWAEVWLPDHGWFPVDCSRDDGEDTEDSARRTRYFGASPWPLLVLVRGDGGEGSLTGFAYHARARWKGTGGKARRRAFWTQPLARADFEALERAPGECPADAARRQAWLFLEGAGFAPRAPRAGKAESGGGAARGGR